MSFAAPLRRRLHISWHIAALSCGVLAGVGLALLAGPTTFTGLAWLVLALALFVAASIGRTAWLLGAALLAGVLLGLWRGSLEQAMLRDYEPYYGQRVNLTGTVAEDTTFGPEGDQRLSLSGVRIGQQELRGRVWVSTRHKLDLKRGDHITVQGKLSEGFGSMPAAVFFAEVVSAQRPRPGDIARELRDWFVGGVRQAVPEPEASLGAGYLVGQRSTLPEDLDEQLRILGLSHVVVASGYNLTILVRFARRALAGISKYLATFAAGLMIAGFVLVTGFSPSMSRAALVTGLSLAAWYYGRTIHPLVLLPFVAAITVIIDPLALWGDLGWYLSFLAFVGVIIVAPLAHAYFWGDKRPGIIRQLVVDTMAAQVATAPLIAFMFGQYSPLALPANLLVLPFVPLAMICTFFAGIIGVALPFAAEFAGWPAYFMLHYMVTVVDWLAATPWVEVEVEFSIQALLAAYAMLVIAVLFVWHKTRYTFRRASVVE